MIPIGLNLKNKPVLIVGGGNVALRKTKLFLSEDAKVTLISPEYLDEFGNLDVNCIMDTYSKTYLENFLIVYACTNDKEVNRQIVDDCNAMNILCGSATRNDKVSFNSMAFEDTEIGLVALSTHQKMPYTKPILNELKNVLISKTEQLEKLSFIREYLAKTNQIDTDLINQMYRLSNPMLDFIVEGIKKQRGYIFVYHQSKYPQQYSFDISPYIVVSLKEFDELQGVFSVLKYLKVIPLLLSDGFIYQKLKKMTNLAVLNPLISNDDDIKMIISKLRKENVINVWMMHPRSQSELISKFKTYSFEDDIVQTFEDELVFDEGKNYHVVMLLMTEGEHYHQLLQKLPTGITSSKILPLEKTIVELLIQKELE